MKNMELVLEVSTKCADKSPAFKSSSGGTVIMTPPVGEDYWLFRVKLGKSQAILGFPKFFTVGIGFAKERDWNTNLPYTSTAEDIFGHIKHNKGSRSISDDDCIAAIKMVQEAAKTYRESGN